MRCNGAILPAIAIDVIPFGKGSMRRPASGGCEEAGGSMHLSVVGPFRLTDAGGVDITPGSALHRAILGVLALTPDAAVSRIRLQDLLWGEKSPGRAAQSLRTALHSLRKHEGVSDIVEIDALTVRLRLERVSVDIHRIEASGPGAIDARYHGAAPDLLEGINLRGGSSEGFEDWLREQRIRWAERAAPRAEPMRPEAASAQAAPAALPSPAASAPSDRAAAGPVIGVLAPAVQSHSIQTRFFADALLDQIAMSLRSQLGARCNDYRDLAASGAGPSDSADIYLRLSAYEEGERLYMRLLALGEGQSLLWSVACTDVPAAGNPASHTEVLAMIGEAVDRVAASTNDGAAQGPVTPFHALSSLFQLDLDQMGELRAGLMAGWDDTGQPIYPAILAYVNTFSVGEHWGTFDEDVREETLELVSAVDESGHPNGLAFALAGHAMGYILHRPGAAADRLSRAVALEPQTAFCWDHLALHHLYSGELAQARDAAAVALRMGTRSPLLYTYETTHSMISTLSGNFQAGADTVQRVLERRPTYGAALRYGAISLANLGRIDEARDCLSRILALDPDFSAGWLRTNRMAVRSESGREILERGLRALGVT